MKILVIHCYYQLRGGEDAVFEQELALLKKEHDVVSVSFRNNTGWKGAVQFLASIWNIVSGKKIRELATKFQPDVIHIHNLHFAVGPIAIVVAKKLRIPVVITLHNFRLLCPSAILQHNGSLFTDSLKASFPWNAVRLKVYRNSYFQTFWLAASNFTHRQLGTWSRVDRFIVLTEFARDLFRNSQLGLTESQLVVKPNFVDSKATGDAPREDHFLFVGRLTEEKGIHVLLEAFKNTPFKLLIAGTGPLETDVIRYCEQNSNVKFMGSLNQAGVYSEMEKCSALIFPSTWYEGMPMTILEALAQSTPIIASNIGAMTTMIDGSNGLHFQVGNSEDLEAKIAFWTSLDHSDKAKFRANARKSFLANYTPAKNIEFLNRIYSDLTTKN